MMIYFCSKISREGVGKGTIRLFGCLRSFSYSPQLSIYILYKNIGEKVGRERDTQIKNPSPREITMREGRRDSTCQAANK